MEKPLIVPPDAPVAEVLAQIRDPRMPTTAAAQVYVCEPPTETPTGRYLGNIGFQALLRQPPAAMVRAPAARISPPSSNGLTDG